MVKPHENILGVRDTADDDGPPKRPKIPVLTGEKRKRELSQHPKDQANREKYRRGQDEKVETARKKIYIGVDLGTKYTGVGYLTGANPSKDVSIISKWGRGQSTFQDKVPTLIGYADDNVAYEGEDRWGYQVKPGDVSFGWWKLLLDDDFEAEKWDDPELRKVIGEGTVRLPPNKSAMQVASHYLLFIYRHLMGQLGETLGAGLKVTPIDFCLTVPATWSHAARDRTRKAAENAGFGSRPGDELLLIDEPQAGILDVLYSAANTYKKDVQPFQKGSTILNCDLGGGTLGKSLQHPRCILLTVTDLISYKVSRLDPLRLEEAAVGVGAKAGASTIDRNFWKFCEKTFGAAFTDLPLQRRANGSKMMAEFEKLKQEFLGTHSRQQERQLEVPLKMKKVDMENPNVRRHYDEDEGRILFTPEEMKSWFQPVLDAGFQLIRDQIAAVREAKMPKVRTIVLSGGLAANIYIEHSFKKFASEELGDVSCMVPERAWSAICRGAALHAFDRSIVLSRRCRDNIGFAVHEAWDEQKHAKEDRIELASGTRAKNQMRWPIRRGMKLGTSREIELPLYTEFDNKQLRFQLLATEQIFTNMDDDSPTRLDDTCSLLGDLKMDLTNSFKKEHKRLKNETGTVSKTVELDVKLKVSPAHEKGLLQFRAVVLPRTQVGRVYLEYCSEPGAGKNAGSVDLLSTAAMTEARGKGFELEAVVDGREATKWLV